MHVSKEELVNSIMFQSVKAEYKLDQYRHASQLQKLDILMANSKLDCQKQTVLEMFELITGTELPVDIHTREFIVLPVGTCLQFVMDYDFVTLPHFTPTCICGVEANRQWKRPHMSLLDPNDWQEAHDKLFVYGLKYNPFRIITDVDTIHGMVDEWPDEIGEYSAIGEMVKNMGVDYVR